MTRFFVLRDASATPRLQSIVGDCWLGPSKPAADRHAPFHHRGVRSIAVLAVIIGLAPAARADQWVTPTQRRLESPDHRLAAVITPAPIPKAAPTATVGPKGGAGTTFDLITPWMPVETVLFDDGSLLALDNWHQLGHGQVATVYERDGKVRWTKTLVELVGQPLVDQAQHSVSSIWWRKTPLEWTLSPDGKRAIITLFDENHLELALRDGAANVVAVASLPDDPTRLFNRAEALADQPGQQAAAIALLERALAKDADRLDAVQLYVHILQRANEHAKVAALLDRESARWKPTTGTEPANVGVLWAASLRALGRDRDAERVLARAVVAAPTYANPALALATLLVDAGRLHDADAVLDAFVARLVASPYLDSYSLAYVADFYARRHDYAKALAFYLKGYDPTQVTNQFLYADLAKVYEAMDNDAEAIRIDEQLLAHFVNMGSAFDTYAKTARDELARLRAKHP
jgi:tetratricopeptide (TPR) repeat protein